MVLDTSPLAAVAHLSTVHAPVSITSSPWSDFGRGGAMGNRWDGEKYPGGFGPTKLSTPDYWTLRTRSAQLFTENLYARGLVRRLITVEINTGLLLDAQPNDELLPGVTERNAEEWTEGVENRFEIWTSSPKLCDFERRRTFSAIQQEARREAIIGGDILVTLRADRRTGLPMVKLIRGDRVKNPLDQKIMNERNIVNGVELDADERQIAYWVRGKEGTSTRVPARGPKSGKRLAWLEYGTDARVDQVRGIPLLGLVLQSLKELDRYRDSEQRAATVNSLLAMFIEKNQPGAGTRPLSAGATRNIQIESTGLEGETREFNISEQWPGIALEELAYGEVPKSFDTRRPNVNYPAFEAAVIAAIAWANEIPPEVLVLQFQSNYSASKAANSALREYVTKTRAAFGSTFCQPIYTEWLLAETLSERIAAPGLVSAWRDPLAFTEFGAWTRAGWGGPVQPSIELKKDIEAYGRAIELHLISRDRASKDLFGVRWSKVMKRRAKEERVLQGFREEFGLEAEPDAPSVSSGARILEVVRDELEA